MQWETPNALFAHTALTDSGWQNNVHISIKNGLIESITPNAQAQGAGKFPLLLPGMPNLHSHAFQRAMAGMTEHSGGKADDNFWSWREVMYGFVSKLTPDTLFTSAMQLYKEMLAAGYTSVVEFHYVHHDKNGGPYPDASEMSQAIIQAAKETGIHLTLLPVMYETADFGGKPPHDGQKRFIHTPAKYIELLHLLKGYENAQMKLGVAFHSLRAVTPESMHEVLSALPELGLADCPIHIHIAEQQKEVQACIAHTGKRPVEWLLEHFDVDARWCLVHATHMNEKETQALAASGAVTGICPTTEANLGDGIFPAQAYMQAAGCFGIGSDSHVSVCPFEELKWLEYSQRLSLQKRTVLCSDIIPSVGRTLFSKTAAAGAQAAGLNTGVIAEGMRADLIAPDMEHYLLADKTKDSILDTLIFATTPHVTDVFVAGQHVVNKGTLL